MAATAASSEVTIDPARSTASSKSGSNTSCGRLFDRPLRSHCPMNIEASLPQVGALVWRDQPAVRGDVQRIVAMWTELLDEHKGPMLFGEFSAADAYFAPVCMRIKNYALPVPGHVTDYIRRVCALSGVKAWVEDALAEKDFLDFEEPYRMSR